MQEKIVNIKKILKKVVIVSIVLLIISSSLYFLFESKVIASKYGNSDEYFLSEAHGDSMYPTIKDGDLLVIKEYDGNSFNISVGDIIVCWWEEHNIYVSHRVVMITNVGGENRYYLKGDNNVNKDVFYITDDEIVGKVEYIIHGWLNKMIFEVVL